MEHTCPLRGCSVFLKSCRYLTPQTLQNNSIFDSLCIAPRVGFEPTTGRLTAVSSATELSGNETFASCWGGIRTPGGRVNSSLPCQLGYPAIVSRTTAGII